MFSLISGFLQYLFAKPKLHVLVIGLDYAGKTTLLEKIKGSFGNLPAIPPEKIPPTIGMNLAKIFYRGHQLVFWDLGGQLKMRSLWEKYYTEANVIVFLVDAVDLGRLEEAKLAYESVCDHDQTGNIPILILANKMDVAGALRPGELAVHLFAIPDAAQRSRVFSISALSGEGVETALNNILEAAKSHPARTVER